jgi:hypothetical protein
MFSVWYGINAARPVPRLRASSRQKRPTVLAHSANRLYRRSPLRRADHAHDATHRLAEYVPRLAEHETQRRDFLLELLLAGAGNRLRFRPAPSAVNDDGSRTVL